MINSISSNLSRIGTWVASTVQRNKTPVALVASAAVAQSCYSMTPAQTLAVYAPALISVAESITPVLANTAASINEWFHKDNELIDKKKRTETLKNRLKNWIQDRHAKGDKSQAAKRILHAFETNALHLNLRDLHLCSLPDVFYHFNHLNSIDLSHNPLTILPPTLKSLPQLEHIYLLGNTSIEKNLSSFKSLSSKCIMKGESPLESIEHELEIWKNDQQVLGNKELASQRILEAFKHKSIILDLSGLSLTSLPHCIDDLITSTVSSEWIDKTERTKNLEAKLKNWIQTPSAKGDKAPAVERLLLAFKTNALHLNLRDLHLTSLPDVFYYFNHLNSIDLSHNPLTILPPTLKSLPQLEHIYLLGNTSIEKNLSSFKSLSSKCIMKGPIPLESIEHELEIWKNDQQVLGNKELASQRILEAFKHKSIIILDLSGLNLTSLPCCIGDLITSTVSRSEWIEKTERTKNLEAKLKNWIQTPSAKGDKAQAAERILFAFKTNALHLNLRDLHLTSLPDVFYYFNHLNSIDLSHNSLSILPPTLKSHPQLKRIYLLGDTLIKKNSPTFKSLAAKCITKGESPLESIEHELEIWKNDQQVLGNKKLASQRILEAFKHKSITLDLSKLDLTSLPHCIGELSALQRLDLDRNQLTTFSIPSTLTALHTLNLFSNQLTTFSIPSTLTALHTLYLFSNQLTTFSIPSTLTALQMLDLDRNQLTSLPAEIRNCLLLSNLRIHNNPNLQTLPISLGEIEGLTTLDIRGTLIPDGMRDSILASCQAKRSSGAVDRLPSQLELWRVSAKMEKTSWPLMSIFDEGDKIAVSEWLTRLARSSDFKCHQQDLAKIVCDILQDASEDSFKALFLTQIKANNECCQDRAAMALNELYVAWRLLCPQQTLSDKEQLKLLLGAGKTLALRGALGEILQKRPHIELESVEIYLYYEIALREKLGLLTATQSMSYESIGRRDWINEEALIDTVNNSYIDHVINLPICNHILEKNKNTKQKLDAVCNKHLAGLELMERCPNEDENSEAVLEWQIQQKKKMMEFKSDVIQCKKECLKALEKAEEDDETEAAPKTQPHAPQASF